MQSRVNLTARTSDKSAVLVTGGAGFVGAHLVRSLVDCGRRVVVADWCDDVARSPLGVLVSEGKVSYLQIDLSDPEAMRFLRREQFGTVFHLAGQPIGWRSAQEKDLTFRCNVDTTEHVLSLVRGGFAARMVLVSSACAFGVPPSGASPLGEFDRKSEGVYPYTASKQWAEGLVKLDADPVAIVRFVNLFGEADWHISRLVPRVITDLVAGLEPRLRRSGSDSKLDFLYVEDAVDALLAVEKHLFQSRLNEFKVFHFGTESPITLGELIADISLLFDGRARNVIEPLSLVEPKIEKFLDSRIARDVLKWSPQVERRDALARTIAWYRQSRQSLVDVDSKPSIASAVEGKSDLQLVSHTIKPPAAEREELGPRLEGLRAADLSQTVLTT